MAERRRPSCLRWVAVLAVACASGPAVRPAAPVRLAAADRLPPPLHLRKLHLVRPDLIPYPVEYAIYC